MVFHRGPGVAKREEMEMVVKPSERIGDGAMQIPERITSRHLNAAPDRRIGPEQRHFELKHLCKGKLAGIHLLEWFHIHKHDGKRRGGQDAVKQVGVGSEETKSQREVVRMLLPLLAEERLNSSITGGLRYRGRLATSSVDCNHYRNKFAPPQWPKP